jgi:hypothetical protein
LLNATFADGGAVKVVTTGRVDDEDPPGVDKDGLVPVLASSLRRSTEEDRCMLSHLLFERAAGKPEALRKFASATSSISLFGARINDFMACAPRWEADEPVFKSTTSDISLAATT